jgi:hypothetical protein
MMSLIHTHGARSQYRDLEHTLGAFRFLSLLFPGSASPSRAGTPLFLTHIAPPNPLASLYTSRSWHTTLYTHDAFMTLPPYAKTSKEIFMKTLDDVMKPWFNLAERLAGPCLRISLVLQL